MLTEDEAKTKWCPFSRTIDLVYSNIASNREVGDYDKNRNETVSVLGRNRCIASACMSWRLAPLSNHKGMGYCGLAGKME